MINDCYRILTVILLLMAYSCGITGYGPTAQAQSIEELLDTLDHTIANKDKLAAQKEARILSLRRQLAQKQQPADRYAMQTLLYDEYYVFNADSALALCDRQLRIADQLSNDDWKAEWHVKRSFILAATGLLEEAEKELASVEGRSHKLPLTTRTEYFRQKIYIYSHQRQYVGNTAEGNAQSKDINANADVKQQLYTDSILLIVPKSDPLYLWEMAWGPNYKKVKGQLEKSLQESTLDNRFDAMNAYSLAHICDVDGDQNGRIIALIKSAIADVRCSNHDIASLEELANILFENGDLERAYRYINHCMENDQAYHNRVRMVATSQLFSEIHHASIEVQHKQRRWLVIGLVLLITLTIALILVIMQLATRIRRSRKEEKELAEANRQQESANEELQRVNLQLQEMVEKFDKANSELSAVNQRLSEAIDDLAESNYVKEETVGMAFTLCSSYISLIDEQRKTLSRLYKTNQTELLRKQLETSQSSAHVKEFFHHFDQMFLNIFPNFVNDFNSLLRPDEHIQPKESDSLNTELRIYALVRLGINDSVKIADFLHCSPQTVYNHRLRVRNKSDIPNSDFAATVQRLGKASY